MNQNSSIQPGDYAYVKGRPDSKVKILRKIHKDPRRPNSRVLLFPHFECVGISKDGQFDKKPQAIPLLTLSSKIISK